MSRLIQAACGLVNRFARAVSAAIPQSKAAWGVPALALLLAFGAAPDAARAQSITAIFPAEGAADASARPADVTITGSNFSASGNAVTFGGTAGTIVSESATSLVVTPPARAAGGQVNVVVTNAGAQSGTAVNAYRYLLPPVVTVNWSPDVIAGQQTTTFTVTVTNPNGVALNGIRVSSNGATTPFYLSAFGTFCGGSGNYNASASFSLTNLNLAANGSCTTTSTQTATAAGVFQFVTSAPTSTGTATTSAPLTGVAATSNTITVYQTPFLSALTPNVGPLTGGRAITITGQNFQGVTAVTIDGIAATNVTVVSATQITATTPAGASAGLKTVAVTNPAGTGSRSNFYQYALPPAAPTISAPAAGASTQAQPLYQGTSPSGASAIVTVYVDGVSIGTATPASNGVWSLQQPTALAAGPHSVYATAATPAGGTSAASATVTFTVDLTAPAAPVITTPAASAVTGARPVIAGTAEAGSTVTIFIDETQVGTAVATGGDWTFTPAAALANGAHTLRATARDAAGNTGASSASIAIVVDTVAPVVQFSRPEFTNTQTLPTETFLVRFNEPVSNVTPGAFTLTATGTAVGTINSAVATGADVRVGITGISGTGTLRVDVRSGSGITDAGGNAGVAAFTAGTVRIVDTVAPAFPVLTGPAPGSTITDALPTLTGTTEPGASVIVYVNNTYAGMVTADGAGVWTLPLTTPLSEGDISVRLQAVDAALNSSGIGPAVIFTLDATAPGTPAITSPANGSTTADTTPLVTGSAEAGATVTVSVDGVAVGTTTATGGSWTFTLATLADGPHTVSATAADAVGNISPASTTITFTVDATAPAAPVIVTPADGSVTDDGTPVISGTAESGATVLLSINGGAPVPVAVIGGAWSYTPTADLPTGQNTLTATATDATGNVSPGSSTVRFTYSPIAISTATLPAGQVGVAYAATVTATGGATPYAFAVTSGALPTGVSLSSTGALSGTPTASGSFGFTLTVTDANSLSASQAYTVTIAAPAAPDADPTTVQVPAASSDSPTTVDLTGQVENAASIEIVSPPAQGSVAVNGLSVVYTPQPGFYGTVTFQYRAIGFSNGGPGAASAPATVTIVIAAPTLGLPGGALPNGRIATAYSQTLAASGGTAPYTYAVTGGALPTGITLAADGGLSGSPTAGGAFSFTVTATDSSTGAGPFSIAAGYTLAIDAPALAVTPTALPNATVAMAYAAAFSTSGGVAPYSYAVTGGALPTGLSLSAGGVLSGTPTQGGAFAFTVTATDASTGAGPYSASQAVTLTVAGSVIAVTPTSLPAGTRGTAYSQTVTASGGVAPYTYAVASGALPGGLTLSPAGLISGTPTATGAFTFQVRATDSAGGAGPNAGTTTVTLTIGAASLTVTPTTLPNVLAGVAYSQALQATGGQGGYTFAVTAGALPTGITLSSAGVLTGRPTAAGVFAFTVMATDGFGNTGSVALSLTVTGRPDPSADPDVRGLSSAQAEATRRMASTQISNFGRRLESLHQGGAGQSGAVLNLSLDGQAFTPLDEGQRSMGELGQVLGRGMGEGVRDLSGRDELARMMVAGRADGGEPEAGPADGRLAAGQGGRPATPTGGPRIWAGGAISLGERDATTQTAEMSITTSGISAGVDMSVADNLDIGVGVGFGQEHTDVGLDVSRLEADSWVGVAYASWRPADSLFVDGILGYGELGFDMRRKTPVNGDVVSGERDGTTWFGSLSTGVDRTVGSTRWIGYGRLEMQTADLDAFAETGSPLWALSYEARTVESLQGALGLRYEREFLRGHDVWTPGFRVEWTREFADAGGQVLRYADWLDGPAYAIGQDGWERSQLNLGVSLGFQARSGWSWSGAYEGGFSNNETIGSLRIRVARSF